MLEKKFSVIIPTLLKSPFLRRLLIDLEECPEVGEVIIIDNVGVIKGEGKQRILSEKKNIFVNPAWNWGVREAKFDYICLCNDDVNFDPKIFKFMLGKKGITGLDTDCYYNAGELGIERITERNWGWGCLIFFHKKEYKEIPNDLLIACGDDYLIKNCETYKLKGLKVDTKISTTSLLPEFLDIQKQDLEIYNKKYR